MSKETRDRKEYLREYMRNKRALAKASGIKIPSDDWAKITLISIEKKPQDGESQIPKGQLS